MLVTSCLSNICASSFCCFSRLLPMRRLRSVWALESALSFSSSRFSMISISRLESLVLFSSTAIGLLASSAAISSCLRLSSAAASFTASKFLKHMMQLTTRRSSSFSRAALDRYSRKEIGHLNSETRKVETIRYSTIVINVVKCFTFLMSLKQAPVELSYQCSIIKTFKITSQ